MKFNFKLANTSQVVYTTAVLAIDDGFTQIEFSMLDISPVKRRQTLALPHSNSFYKQPRVMKYLYLYYSMAGIIL